VLALGEVGGEAIGIEAERGGVGNEFLVREGLWVVVESIVHRPECALRADGFGGFCGVFRVWVDLGEREVAVDVAEPIAQTLPDFLDLGGKTSVQSGQSKSPYWTSVTAASSGPRT
jgi:hypothetical protein